MKFSENYSDCYVLMDGNMLKIGNSRMERSWDMSSGSPALVSLKNKKTGWEWLKSEHNMDGTGQANGKAAFMKTPVTSQKYVVRSISTHTDDDFGAGIQYFEVEVELECSHADIRWVHVIYPQIPVFRSYIKCTLKHSLQLKNQNTYTREKQSEYEGIENKLVEASENDDYIDFLPLRSEHCCWKSVRLNDRTDLHNNLVQEKTGLFYVREKNSLEGNLCFIKDTLSGNGMILVKEGPTPFAYQGGMKSDFIIEGSNVYMSGWGFTPSEIDRYKELQTYPGAVILWCGDEMDALKALRQYNSVICRFDPQKDGFVMSNTWGDRSRDGRVSESFVLNELQTAERLGVGIYQIDDGWQRGNSANSVLGGGVWEGYYEYNSNFWDVNETRFPTGLMPLAQDACSRGIRLALWFSPDSTNDFCNWERDASKLIELHVKYGIVAYKLDGIKIRSKKGEENLVRLMQKVRQETNRQVFFNMDVTAEVRSGYYGRVQYGNLFLENRYTDSTSYYPHYTLRNLWMLSRYYPSYRLQVEFLNVKRNMQKYDNVFAPANCGIEYAFAVTMMANPLAWMELTGLDDQSIEILLDAIPVYRKHQQKMLSGIVLPIGEEPFGTSWTGFQSITADGEGYILIFREYNHENKFNFKLWNSKSVRIKLERILGYGTQTEVQTDGFGTACFELDKRFSYALYKYNVI